MRLNGGVDNPIISASELADAPGTVKLYDLRWALTDPTHGINTYKSGHIPGAVFVDLDQDLSGKGDGRHPLPATTEFTATLGRLGVGRDDHVVVYDDMMGTIAARMWWMLKSIGHSHVRVLDGGIKAWIEGGHPIATGIEQPTTTTYPEVESFAGVVNHADLAGRLVIDVRAPDRYTGEHEPVDPKAGHIPGAINLPTTGNLDSRGRFLSPGDLAARHDGVAAHPVLSCGSGVNACHAALAMELAGLGGPDIYIGSFSDWSSRDLPVHTGPQP